MSKKTAVKKATKKAVEPKVVVVLVEKKQEGPSELEKVRLAHDARLQAVIDSHKPGAQLSADLNSEIHCHNCGHQVEVDHNFCEQCGVKLIGICKTCGIIKKARIDPCPICLKIS